MASSYKLSTTVDRKYAPLINYKRMLDTQIQKSEFAARRESGATNVDLWCNGSLYPQHPVLGKRPSFRSVSNLLEFVGEGKNGLLGYVESLSSADFTTLKSRFDESQSENAALREQVRCLMTKAEEREQLLQFTETELLARKAAEEPNQTLLLESYALKSELRTLRDGYNRMISEYTGRLSQLQVACEKSSDDLLETEIKWCIELENLKEEHSQKLKSVAVDLKRTKAHLRRREVRLEKLVKTPYGYCSIQRQRKDLHSLAPTGGHAKRTLGLVRRILVPKTASSVHFQNSETGSSQRLCGSKDTQTKTGKVLASMLFREEVKSMCSTTKFDPVRVEVANQYMQKIGESVGAHEILETMDGNGITHSSYSAIYKRFKGAAKGVSEGLRIGCLPNPLQISNVRKMLNLKLCEYVGEYYSITDTLQFPPSPKLKNKDAVTVALNEYNNIFTDVEQVQRTMVELYGITPTELQGRPLIFVLKMDEAEIIHAQKLERVSITLMNRALDPNIEPSSEDYFSVQSEREIWPVASFQIPKESYEILRWVFSKTKIPQLILAQEASRRLEVPGIGSFAVEWHMSCDMKTLKCLFGLKHGANCLHTCIYCCQERSTQVVGTVAQAEEAMTNKKFFWSGGLFSASVQAKPLEGDATFSRWKPIFSIPLDRVHVCTLHALNRMIEKMVHLHFIHVWTIRDEALQKVATDEMQRCVSLTGAHGGNVVIFKDSELSGKSNSVPNKPSFSGAHVLKLFKINPTDHSPKPKLLYEAVVAAEKNIINRGQARRNKLQCWEMLDDLRP